MAGRRRRWVGIAVVIKDPTTLDNLLPVARLCPKGSCAACQGCRRRILSRQSPANSGGRPFLGREYLKINGRKRSTKWKLSCACPTALSRDHCSIQRATSVDFALAELSLAIRLRVAEYLTARFCLAIIQRSREHF